LKLTKAKLMVRSLRCCADAVLAVESKAYLQHQQLQLQLAMVYAAARATPLCKKMLPACFQGCQVQITPTTSSLSKKGPRWDMSLQRNICTSPVSCCGPVPPAVHFTELQKQTINRPGKRRGVHHSLAATSFSCSLSVGPGAVSASTRCCRESGLSGY
jgi:hypothetical protein